MQKNDARNRLNEAITRMIVGTCLPACRSSDSEENWINPTEDCDQVLSIKSNISLLNASLQEVGNMEQECSPAIEVTSVMQFTNVKSNFETLCLTETNTKEIWKDIEGTCRKRKAENPIHSSHFTSKLFVQCLTHPDVVSVISKMALDKFMNNA